MAQGKTGCYCGNPYQPNMDLRNYVYSGFGCELGVEGRHETRVWNKPSLWKRIKTMILKAIEK